MSATRLRTCLCICRPNMGLQSLPKPKTSRSQADSLSLCVSDCSHLVINVVHIRFLAFDRVLLGVCFCNTSVCICRPNMGLQSLPKQKTFSSQANSLSLCASDFSHLVINVVHTRFLEFARVCFCNTSVYNATAYILAHLQAEHGTAVTAETENLAKPSRQLELVC